MPLRSPRSRPAVSWLLLVGPLLACRIPATDPSLEPPALSVPHEPPARRAPRPPTEPPKPVVDVPCPAEVGLTPREPFGGKVALSLPVGVDAVLEQNAFFAVMDPMPARSVSCIDGAEAASIEFGAMGFFSDDPQRPIEEMADETLDGIYHGSYLRFLERHAWGAGDQRGYLAVVDIPFDAERDEAFRVLLSLESAHGRVHWLIWETRARDWVALEPTLRLSADTVVIRP